MKAVGLGSIVVLILCLGSGIQAVKRYRDVMTLGSQSGHKGNHNQVRGWSPGSNSWDEMRYPAWKAGDARWENCWKGGKVVALLTSDGPALIGSNVTFAVTLQFPRCQRENDDGDIVYDRRCRNDTSIYQEQYVYNWTKWVDYCDQGNCSFINTFPDGQFFPQHPNWRRRNFVYIFHTLGQYYQKLGGPWTTLSLNTTNITAGTQMMEVSVYRRERRRCYPVAKASSIYVVTDEIPFYVNISQKNDRNSSDKIFIKDSPISFDVQLHDPSHYLDDAVVTYNWSFGDGNGSFISNDPKTKHAYTLLGNYSLKLTVKAAIPGPCNPVTPTPPVTTTHYSATVPTTSNSTGNITEFPFVDTKFPFTTEGPNMTTFLTTTQGPPTTTEAAGCFIYRYGHYKTNLTIVDGILEVNILQMTDVQVSASQAQSSVIDFVVSCQGSLPKDACTVISDYTCMVPQDMVCDQVNASDQCMVTLRRSFAEPGTYCVNITLRDDASMALASTLVSVNGFRTQRTIEGILIPLGLVAIVAAVIGALLYKKYKEYKPIRNSTDQRSDEGIIVYFNQIKSGLFKQNSESDPLLKSKAGII